MESILNILGLLFTLASLGACAMSKGPLNEIEGSIFMVIAAIFFAGGAIVGALGKFLPAKPAAQPGANKPLAEWKK